MIDKRGYTDIYDNYSNLKKKILTSNEWEVINVNFNPAVKQQLILIAANSVVWTDKK